MRNTKNSKLKSNTKGITLIALVITIIVLLILAGVTIATLTGDNGILTRAQDAKDKTEQAEKDEKTNLAKTEDLINQYVNGIEVEQVTDENPGVLEGTGTDDDPYTINSIEDLVVFASNVTNGNTYEGQTVKLGLSLDFNSTKSYVDPLRTDYGQYGYDGELKTLLTSGEGFKTIGNIEYTNDIIETDIESSKGFKGTFDGNNKVITNLLMNKKTETENRIILGLFSNNYGIIKNLGLNNANILLETNNASRSIVSGIASLNNGKIINCYFAGKVKNISNGTGSGGAGGITAINYGTIETSYNSGNIIGVGLSSMTVGGITRANQGKILNCYNKGEIFSEGNYTVVMSGGICGTASYVEEFSIENCYNFGKIIGINNKELSNSRVGGIIGDNAGNIIYCYNLGEIRGKAYYLQLGGISGFINGELGNIQNCYDIGNTIDDTDYEHTSYIGSICGRNYKGKIDTSYYVEGKQDVGQTNSPGVSTTYSLKLTEMPKIIDIIGNEFKEDTNNINNGYPILSWQ